MTGSQNSAGPRAGQQTRPANHWLVTRKEDVFRWPSLGETGESGASLVFGSSTICASHLLKTYESRSRLFTSTSEQISTYMFTSILVGLEEWLQHTQIGLGVKG